jgi:hypothetical protein
MTSDLIVDVYEVHLPLVHDHIENGKSLDTAARDEFLGFVLGYVAEICDFRVTLLIADLPLSQISKSLSEITIPTNEDIPLSEIPTRDLKVKALIASLFVLKLCSVNDLTVQESTRVLGKLNELVSSLVDYDKETRVRLNAQDQQLQANWDLLLGKQDEDEQVFEAYTYLAFDDEEKYPEFGKLLKKHYGNLKMQQDLITMYRSNLLNHNDNSGTVDLHLGTGLTIEDALTVCEYSPHEIVGDFELEELASFISSQSSELKMVVEQLVKQEFLSEETGEVCSHIIDNFTKLDFDSID